LSEQTSYKLLAFCYDDGKNFIGRYGNDFSNIFLDRKAITETFSNVKYIRFAFRLSTNGVIEQTDIDKLKNVIYVNSDIGEADTLLSLRARTIKARFDEQFNYIAYSKLNVDDAPTNTEEHYLNCAKANFTSLKGDVQPTSDGALIMCHDDGYTFDADGKITTYDATNNTPINTLTLAQCKALTFATQYNGADCHPTDFETFVQICKTYGKCAFVTIREDYIAQVVVPEMMRVLKKYRMTDHAIINSFSVDSLNIVRGLDADIMLSLVLPHHQAPTISDVDTVYSLGNCLLSYFCFPTEDDADLDTVLTESEEVLNYAYDKNVIVYAGQTANSHTPILMKHGIMGSQMYRKPNHLD